MPKKSTCPALIFDTATGPVPIPQPVAADLCRVSARTVARWQATGDIPPTAAALLALYADGRIIPTGDRRALCWRYVRFRHDHLHIDGEPYTAGQLRALVFNAKQRRLAF